MEGLKRAENRVHETEEKLKGVQANDRELKSDFQGIDFEKLQAGIDKISSLGETILVLVRKLDAFAKRLDETTQQQPPILEVLEQIPADFGGGNSKEQGTCFFDVSLPPLPPSASIDSWTHYHEDLTHSCSKA